MASIGTVTRGDYEEITFAVTNPNGSARNITTDTIKFSAKVTLKDAAPLVTKISTDATQIVKTNAAGGIGKVVLQPTDLAAIDKDGRVLFCDIVVTDSSSRPYSTRFELSVILDVSS